MSKGSKNPTGRGADDDALGMNAPITRRDLLHDAGMATLAMALGLGGAAARAAVSSAPAPAD